MSGAGKLTKMYLKHYNTKGIYRYCINNILLYIICMRYITGSQSAAGISITLWILHALHSPTHLHTYMPTYIVILPIFLNLLYFQTYLCNLMILEC